MCNRSGCHSGLGSTGIAGGTNVKVQFSLKSNDTNISKADQIVEHLYSLFHSFESGDRWSKARWPFSSRTSGKPMKEQNVVEKS